MPDQSRLNLEKPLDTVEDYKFEPIKGYPMLNWKGKRPFTSTQYYPAQLKENHGAPVDGWMNEIYWGDNLQVMSHLLKKYRGKIQLVYIDPPFDSKAEYKRKINLKGKQIANDHNTFEEKQYNDIWTNDEYLQFMYERLILIRELISDSGTLYLHCDQHKNHQIRCLLDEIFGSSNFLNEVIWCYSERGISKTYWNKKHDNLLVYVKAMGNQIFNYNEVRDEYSDEYLKKFKYEDENGKYQIRGKNIQGSPVQRADGLTPAAELKYPGLTYRQYMTDGMLPKDWWELPLLNKASNERQGYPTQKPENLVEKIITASSNQGDIVFDCFMGSGTAQAVAMKLGRRFIGADINLGAIQITTKRLIQVAKELTPKQKPAEEQMELLKAADVWETFGKEKTETGPEKFYTGFSVYNVNHYDIFRNPVQAKELLIEALEIQPLPGNTLYDGEKDGRMVKIMPINRIATKADLNELITNFDYKEFEKKFSQNPNQPVASLLLVCMGHEPDLAAMLQKAVKYRLDVEVVDILRDKANLEFKRDAEARVAREDGELVIQQFYPMNLLQKLSLAAEEVEDWRELVESVMVDFYYDGSVFEPTVVDVPDKNELVTGRYKIPGDAGTIRLKITDLLSESLEVDVN